MNQRRARSLGPPEGMGVDSVRMEKKTCTVSSAGSKV
jgi:hypothetical protein